MYEFQLMFLSLLGLPRRDAVDRPRSQYQKPGPDQIGAGKAGPVLSEGGDVGKYLAGSDRWNVHIKGDSFGNGKEKAIMFW